MERELVISYPSDNSVELNTHGLTILLKRLFPGEQKWGSDFYYEEIHQKGDIEYVHKYVTIKHSTPQNPRKFQGKISYQYTLTINAKEFLKESIRISNISELNATNNQITNINL